MGSRFFVQIGRLSAAVDAPSVPGVLFTITYQAIEWRSFSVSYPSVERAAEVAQRVAKNPYYLWRVLSEDGALVAHGSTERTPVY